MQNEHRPWGWPWVGLAAVAALYAIFWLTVKAQEERR